MPEDLAEVILCADDFGISDGVSAAIEELALSGQISATSAIVTFDDWCRCGNRLARLRNKIAIGLHLNFTVGRPLGPANTLAPRGAFLPIRQLLQKFPLSFADEEEIVQEVLRQIAHFREAVGYSPDFVDGHQHAHVLPALRRGVLKALEIAFPDRNVFVRDPGDHLSAILGRGIAIRKATAIATLAMGFRQACTQRCFATNIGFSGFSNFRQASPYSKELKRFFLNPGCRHLVMCHPGFPDRVLASRDTLLVRREEEFQTIRAASWLDGRIWKPDRTSGRN